MDLNKLPKQFCDSITVAYTPEFFAFVMINGDEMDAYSLTPAHAKRLMQYLAHNVSEYEKQFGGIEAEWKPGVQSPIQMVDLNRRN
jgi:hypothetical protein